MTEDDFDNLDQILVALANTDDAVNPATHRMLERRAAALMDAAGPEAAFEFDVHKDHRVAYTIPLAGTSCVCIAKYSRFWGNLTGEYACIKADSIDNITDTEVADGNAGAASQAG